MTGRLVLPSACVVAVLGVLGTTDRVSLGRVAASAETTARPPLASSMATGASRVEGYGDLPLSFEPTDTLAADGQSFDFLAQGRGYRLDLSGREAVLTLHRGDAGADTDLSPADTSPTEPERLALRVVGGRADAAAHGEAELPGKVHYLRGAAPSAWRTNVPTYAQVRYEAVYPGIDLVYYGNQGELEYDFVVAPGADPTVIELAFDGVRTIEVDAAGDLVLHTPAGVVRQHKPFLYQEVDGQRQVVDGRYALDRAQVRIEVGAYDTRHPLVIDPVLVYSGGAGSGSGATGVAVDAAGNAYVGGNTHPGSVHGGRDGFVRKINAAGSAILWTTYIGGSNDDSVYAIALDGAGAAHVTGRTRSTDFPTTLASYDFTYNGGSLQGFGDAFVAKLTADGAGFAYTTYLGGASDDAGHGIAVRDGHAYVVGETAKSFGAEFPTTPGAFQTVRPGLHTAAFVTRFDAAGALVFSTFLGSTGGHPTTGHAIAVDAGGNAYVTGAAAGGNFPTVNPAQTWSAPMWRSGNANWAFITKLNPAGTALVYSTYFGGGVPAFDNKGGIGTEGLAIAVDAAGSAYVTGETQDVNLPVTAGAFQQSCPFQDGTSWIACRDAFVTKLSPDGGTIVYATYLGALQPDYGNGIAVDAAGRAYLTGGTSSPDFPVLNAYQPTKGMSGSGTNAFFTVVNPAGSGLEYSTYLGGSDGETGYAVTLDTGGNAYVVGSSVSSNFPRVGGLPGAGGGTVSEAGAFIAKFSAIGCTYAATPTANISAPAAGSSGTITLTTGAGCGWATSKTVNWLTLTPTSGSGPGAVMYTVGPNSSLNPRVGSFTIANTSILAQQAGVTPGACTYTVAPTSLSPPAVGTSATITVTTTASCAWEATSTVPWATVGAGRTGSGSVTYTVTPNLTASARTGGLFIAGHTVPVTQAAGPATNCTGDADCDGLPTTWETQFGLNATSAAGEHGPDGDPDGDGRTNAQELADGTHPRGFYTRYLAEGATSTFFDTRIALANPNTEPAQTLLRFLRAAEAPVSEFRSIGARTRATVTPKTLPTLAVAEFSTVVESDLPIVVERTMEWDGTGYGSHAETSLGAPATTWYLAEGATHSGFSLFYLIQNPTETAAQVQVTYLLPAPAAPVVATYDVGPNSRFNIWVNQVGPALASTDVSAVITSINDVPIIVERAMYLDRAGQFFGAGHNSAGVTAPATQWFLAEGATGSYFDLFILIANPGATAATVTATYLLPSGQTMAKVYQVAGNSRFNIWVDFEDAALADTAVSTTLTSTVPVIVERSMWWPTGLAAWHEAHNSPGATATAPRWALAEGEVGGARGYETYILLANTSATPGDVQVTLLFDDGTTSQRTFPVGATSRFNVDVGAEFPTAVGRRFGAVIESLGPTPIALIVERAMYSNAAGVRWAAGTNALGTRLP